MCLPVQSSVAAGQVFTLNCLVRVCSGLIPVNIIGVDMDSCGPLLPQCRPIMHYNVGSGSMFDFVLMESGGYKLDLTKVVWIGCKQDSVDGLEHQVVHQVDGSWRGD